MNKTDMTHQWHQTNEPSTAHDSKTVTRLSPEAFDTFEKALNQPIPETARKLITMNPEWL
ncbi:hypothetical protein [Bifidobacterium sp. SO1]|uniref:hypothetical protein n=1 Tax=Bifidobacterium sp. SO1 TaxID=2809029 RepID=UPI001BDBE138|nr:hypothetical protein [Bifidobacterium sp. SO1]MBT1162225.1 hypothetical protein [Bifidobacterium sp. SO1]